MTETTPAPVVGIVGGSRSDFPTLEAAVAVLDELGVPSELKVVSAHRTPGPPVPLRGGGRRPAGSGSSSPGPAGPRTCPGCSPPRRPCRSSASRSRPSTSAAWTRSCRSSRCRAACPVATVAIGNATNAGLLAAAILALSDDALAERLAAWRARQTQAVLDDPSNT